MDYVMINNYLSAPTQKRVVSIDNWQNVDCELSDTYKFERKRLGKNTVTESYRRYGTYLYRNIRTGVLVASWEKPNREKEIYSGEDVGINTDALVYYKNE